MQILKDQSFFPTAGNGPKINWKALEDMGVDPGLDSTTAPGSTNQGVEKTGFCARVTLCCKNRICSCVTLCVYIYIYLYVYVYRYVTYMYMYIYIHVCIYRYTYIHICICICMYIYAYVYIYIYAYIHIYIHTHTHIYIYIYIFIAIAIRYARTNSQLCYTPRCTHTHTHTHTGAYIHEYMHNTGANIQFSMHASLQVCKYIFKPTIVFYTYQYTLISCISTQRFK